MAGQSCQSGGQVESSQTAQFDSTPLDHLTDLTDQSYVIEVKCTVLVLITRDNANDCVHNIPQCHPVITGTQ